MDKYRKVMKPKGESQPKDDEEIRVTAVGSVSAYVSRAATVYGELAKSKVVIRAQGNALTKAVTLAEVIKRRFKGLHQVTNIGQSEVVDEYEPLEEGLDKVTQTRNIPFVEITLSKDALDAKDKGYQAPIDESLVKELDAEELMKPRGGRGRGRGKGGGRGNSKGKGKGRDGSASKGKGKGKGKKEAPPSKGKGKGKGKAAEPKGKGKGKSKAAEPKGKGKGKSKAAEPKGKGKSKGKGKAEAPKGKSKGKAEPKGKGKSSGKGKSRDYYESSPSYSKGSKGKGKGKGKSTGKGWW